MGLIETIQQMLPYLIAIAAAWLVAHGVKIMNALKQGSRASLLSMMFISGGMPSSHAAVMVAVWTTLVLSTESSPGLLGLATAMTAIVCYDAVKVRRSVGEQGQALRSLIRETNSSVELPRAARGHTPLEVVVGAATGAVVGVVVYSTMM